MKDNAMINVVKEDIPIVMNAVKESMKTNHPINVNYHIHVKGKNDILIRLDANIVNDIELAEEDDSVWCAVHTIVSENTLQALKELEQYRKLLNISEVAYFEMDKENGIYVSDQLKKYIVDKLGYPFIIKKLNSKGGRDIFKIDDKTMFDNLSNKIPLNNYIFQQYINTNTGKDVRVVLVGGKVVGSFMRVNENDFRSNISLGGKAITYEVSDEYKKVAEKTAKILELDYCSVDFFLIENDSPMVCEVNSDPALCDIEELNKINVAEIYAKYIYNEIYKNKEK